MLLIFQVHTIMVDNIDKILERGDRIELLVDKTATMQDNAFHFRKQSKRLRQALWMKNAKLLVMLTCLIVLLLYIIIAASCGGLTLPSCRFKIICCIMICEIPFDVTKVVLDLGCLTVLDYVGVSGCTSSVMGKKDTL
ncbi:hypothetical protein RD792_009882 [Penstemon davidsonii]|uniref:V-SNARE coiled-coil homology domain-containing protein n=1 Tax=Penstemon davidsonii TaxID=160366 RepID=A0ABR0D0A3_9LAMI|nr:hypothetical protein RD792_009882 [Penstemon davidsonii]